MATPSDFIHSTNNRPQPWQHLSRLISHCAQPFFMKHCFFHHEAVIKVLKKRNRPSVRHISRTHTVDLDWLLDMSNLHTAMPIKYVSTTNRLQISHEGIVHRWLQLLQLFGLMSHDLIVASSVVSPTSSMAKHSGENSRQNNSSAQKRTRTEQ